MVIVCLRPLIFKLCLIKALCLKVLYQVIQQWPAHATLSLITLTLDSFFLSLSLCCCLLQNTFRFSPVLPALIRLCIPQCALWFRKEDYAIWFCLVTMMMVFILFGNLYKSLIWHLKPSCYCLTSVVSKSFTWLCHFPIESLLLW